VTGRLSVKANAEKTGNRYLLQILLLTALAVTYLGWSWTKELVGLGGDNALYVLMARHYSPYFDPGNDIAGYFSNHSQFPPLYPLVLAMLGGAYDLLAAHQITTGLLILSFAVLPRWTIQLGLPPNAGAALVVAFALLPGTYTETLYLHSENLYLLLTLAFFAISGRPHLGRGQFVALAVLAASTALTRTAGIALLGAFAVHLIIRRPTGWLVYIGIAVTPVLLWNVHAYSLGRHYLGFAIPTGNADPIDEILSRLDTQLQALQYGWAQNFSSLPSLWVHCLALGALCLGGSGFRLVRLELDGLYVLFYFLLLLFWPFPGESVRFMFVVVPVLLVQGTWLAEQLLNANSSHRRFQYAAYLIPLVTIMLSLPQALLAIQRIQMPLPKDLVAFKRDPDFLAGTPDDALMTAQGNSAISMAMHDIATIVPSSDCILAIKPSIVALISDRVAKSPPPASVPDHDFEHARKLSGCKYVLMLNLSSSTYDTPMYPLARMQDRIRVLRAYEITNPRSQSSTVAAAIGEVMDVNERALPVN
jgi:hypothetical protein